MKQQKNKETEIKLKKNKRREIKTKQNIIKGEQNRDYFIKFVFSLEKVERHDQMSLR